MQALLRCYRWDWKDLRAELPGLARAWLPCDPGDLTGPGIAVDETAQLKDGDATACVAPQHAGCTGHVENCVTTVFPAWVATSGHTALAALAQLRDTAIRNHLYGDITLPGATAGVGHDDGSRDGEDDISGPDLRIPLGDAPVPARGGQPCPPRIAAIRLTIAETARLERLARQHAAGLITRARLAFCLRWSRWRRCHQARARWHHYSTRLLAAAPT